MQSDPPAEPGDGDGAGEGERIEVRLFLEAIRARYGYDLSGYAPASMRRRVLNALAASGLGNLGELQHRVLHDPRFFAEVFERLTVRVSELFRDPDFYRAFRELATPTLRTYARLNVWVSGCASGEEAYSMAILLKEENLLDRAIVYATDINPHSLQAAQAGVYELTRLPAFTENYQKAGGHLSLSQYYTAQYGRARMTGALRDRIVFSDHSLATDSVFAEVHLVSCRNVLIYFNRELQDRAVALFREALCRKGFLGIGSRESLRFSTHAASFSPFVRDERIYQKEDPQ